METQLYIPNIIKTLYISYIIKTLYIPNIIKTLYIPYIIKTLYIPNIIKTLYIPYIIKTTKMHRYSIYLQILRVPLNCMSFHTHFIVWVLLIIEVITVTVECRTIIKVLFLYINLCLSVMFGSISCSSTFSWSVSTYTCLFTYPSLPSTNALSLVLTRETSLVALDCRPSTASLWFVISSARLCKVEQNIIYYKKTTILQKFQTRQMK